MFPSPIPAAAAGSLRTKRDSPAALDSARCDALLLELLSGDSKKRMDMFQLEEGLTGFVHISELYLAQCSHLNIVRGPRGDGPLHIYGVEGTPAEPYVISLGQDSLISDFATWGAAVDGTVGPPGFLSLGSSVK